MGNGHLTVVMLDPGIIYYVHGYVPIIGTYVCPM